MPLRRENQLNYAHLFSGTKPLAKLYLGKIGLPDFSVTFANLTANRYFRYSPANNNGSITPAYFGTQLDAVWYYYSNYDQASAQSTYQVDFKSTVTKTPSALEINGRSYPITPLTGITETQAYGTAAITRTEDIPSASSLTLSYKIRFSDGTYLAVDNSEIIWENTSAPSITAFSVFPDTVDLDIADNHKTASVTFEKRSTGIYWFISRQYENRPTDTGSSSGFPALVSVGHYYIGTTGRLSGPPSDSHYYQFAVRNTDSNYRDYNAIVINGRSYSVASSSSDFTEHGITGREYWTTDRIPNSADWVTDGRLTLSIQFRVSKVPDRLTFSYNVAGTQLGGTSTPTTSNIMFYHDSSSNPSLFIYSLVHTGVSSVARGTSSVSNTRLLNITYWTATSSIITGRRDRYLCYFLNTFLMQQTPITIAVDGTSYSLGFELLSRDFTMLKTGALSATDRPSATDLTKAIQFDLVDNIQVNLDSSTFSSNLPDGSTITYTSSRRDWTIRTPASVTGTIDQIIINGRALSIRLNHVLQSGERLWISQNLTLGAVDNNFVANASKLSWGVNARFSDGTYLNNTRSKLFTTISTGGSTYGQIYAEPQASKVGPQEVATGGADLTGSIPNIERPNKSQNYRLVARNAGGSSHRDITFTLTKNPTITNLRRTNVIARTGFSTYTFAMTVTGLPRPVVDYIFSGGQTGIITPNHYIQGANNYTWNISNWTVTFANSDAQSLRVTATNSSGFVIATLANING